jgi:ribosomal protein S12 methylthiotransferase accessory factor YcaO
MSVQCEVFACFLRDTGFRYVPVAMGLGAALSNADGISKAMYEALQIRRLYRSRRVAEAAPEADLPGGAGTQARVEYWSKRGRSEQYFENVIEYAEFSRRGTTAFEAVRRLPPIEQVTYSVRDPVGRPYWLGYASRGQLLSPDMLQPAGAEGLARNHLLI